METCSPPQPAIDLSNQHYYQLVYTLTGLLPPPLDGTPEALSVRNHAAIARVAALLPVNANEADLAAQCIAARAQAEDLLRLLRQHAGDIGLVMRLNAQYGSMVRTSLSVHGRLMRVQALRRKREATGTTVSEDAWALHVAEQSMLAVAYPDAGLPKGALDAASPKGTSDVESLKVAPVVASPKGAPDVESPEGAPDVESPKAAPDVESPKGALDNASPKGTPDVAQVEAPVAYMDQKVVDTVSETTTNSQDTGFETWLSEQPWNSSGSGDTHLRELLREALAKSRSGRQRSPTTDRQSPGRAD